MWTASLASGVWLCSAVGAGVFIYRYELVFIWGENWHFDCVFLGRDKYFEECVCVGSVHVVCTIAALCLCFLVDSPFEFCHGADQLQGPGELMSFTAGPGREVTNCWQQFRSGSGEQ